MTAAVLPVEEEPRDDACVNCGTELDRDYPADDVKRLCRMCVASDCEPSDFDPADR